MFILPNYFSNIKNNNNNNYILQKLIFLYYNLKYGFFGIVENLLFL